MTFEQMEKAKRPELRAEAKKCFEIAQDNATVNEYQAAKMLEAQFYMQELDRRHDSWIERRDFWLELAVIMLILAEIILSVYGIRLAIKQGHDEDLLMDK
jgi:hypothetical protein